MITSVKPTVIGITSPTLYEPLTAVEVTPVTVGTVVSITKSLLAPKELVAPGLAKVKLAEFKAASFMVLKLLEIIARPDALSAK